MKRIGNIYGEICRIENLMAADAKAQKGKAKQPGVQQHNRRRGCDLIQLQELLLSKSYRTSAYTTFKVYEPKEREVFRLPFFPDRIAHHAIMAILEPLFMAVYTADTYSCIKGRGIHGAANAVKRALRDVPGTTYCLKLDIQKFYPNVDHEVLKELLRHKIKDNDLLWLLDEIIDSAPGLPIGNYLSQFLANFYLTYFDHWLKEVKGVKYYFRYADDIVIFGSNKPELHTLLSEISDYLRDRLKLNVKKNYQVFPTAARGIDFVGYRFYHTHTLLRKRIKQNYARMLVRNPNAASIASYKGWLDHCDSENLQKKLLHEIIQRPGHKGNAGKLHRKQNRHVQHTEPGDHRACLQNRQIEVRQMEREMPPVADNAGWDEARGFHRIGEPDGRIGTDQTGRLSLYDDNKEG